MKKTVVIVGAGVAGRDVLKEIGISPGLNLAVLGFIDDDPKKLGLDISGVKVLGARSKLRRLIREKKIGEVIIAIPSAYGESIAQYIKICAEEKVDARIVPRVREIIEGKAHIRTLRKARVEDLLGRPIVKTDIASLKTFFKAKRVLITGAAGSIGSELSRQLLAYNPKAALLIDWSENGLFELKEEFSREFPKRKVDYVLGNIQEQDKTLRLFSDFRPDYVFHAAAHKHVPLMEDCPDEAVENNVFGTLNIIKASLKVGVKRLVIVSTDKAARPKSVMGATKLIAEGLAKIYNDKSKTKIMAVRFGNVLDSQGSVLRIFREQIERGGPVTVTDKRMTRYLMAIPEAVQLVFKAALIGRGGDLFVLVVGEPVRILDIAENMIRLSGFVPGKDIEIVYTGVRKGEKIREILFDRKEKGRLTKTIYDKIFISESLGLDLRELPKHIDRLRGLARQGDKEEVRGELAKLVKTLPK